MSAPAAKPRRNRRVPKVSTPDTRETDASSVKRSAGNHGSRDEPATRDFRRRMSCAGQLVREVFGLDHETDSALVTRDAYLIVVSRIIRALASGEQELSTGELASLSKALAEHRRLDISQMEVERRFPEQVSNDDTLESGAARPLPAGFGRMVEQIYGTNPADSSDDDE